MKRYIRAFDFDDEEYTSEPTPSAGSTQYTGTEMIEVLDGLDEGTPLLINDSVRWAQAIYVGQGEVQGRMAYRFYDGGMAPFAFTTKFIKEYTGKVAIVLDDNDPVRVSELLRSLGK